MKKESEKRRLHANFKLAVLHFAWSFLLALGFSSFLLGEDSTPSSDALLQGGVENSIPPRVSCIYSPRKTVYLQAGHVNRFLRVPETLPKEPFTLFTQANDLVEVQFEDGSVIRQGPQTLVEYIPSLRQVSIAGGSILGHFSRQARLKVNHPEVQGRDCAFMISVGNKGIKVFSLCGKCDFQDQPVEEGEMFYVRPVVIHQQPVPNHQTLPKSVEPIEIEGPCLIDLAELISSSPLTVEFPESRWVREITRKPIERQKLKKNLGLLEPGNLILEGGDATVKQVK